MEIDNAVAETQEYMMNNYPSWNKQKGEALARFFYDAIDKEGMIIPFDLTWQMAGYSRKDVAKDKLTGRKGGKLNLVEGTDYKIVHVSKGNRKHGGSNKEQIFLTVDAFRKFIISSSKNNSWVVPYINKLWQEANKYSKSDKEAKKRRLIIEVDRKELIKKEQSNKSVHDTVKCRLAKKVNGNIEVPNKFGVVDIESNTQVIEVKPVRDYKHALGQALFYSVATGKRPRVHLYGGKLTPEEEEVFKKIKMDLSYE